MYNRAHLKAYARCNAANNSKWRQRTKLLVFGFIHQMDIDAHCTSNDDNNKMVSVLCKMYGNLHMFHGSEILSSADDKVQLQKLISSSLYNRNIAFKSTKLIFNSRRDGFDHAVFSKKCSHYTNTLIIIQSDPRSADPNSESDTNSENYYSSDSDCNANHCDERKKKMIFGAFTSKEWNINNELKHIKDENAFLYRLRANKYGASVFPLKDYPEFALYHGKGECDEDDDDTLFYFGQPACLLISDHSDSNYKSYCCGGEKCNFKIPYRGSLMGVMHSSHFKVVNFEVFHID